MHTLCALYYCPNTIGMTHLKILLHVSVCDLLKAFGKNTSLLTMEWCDSILCQL